MYRKRPQSHYHQEAAASEAAIARGDEPKEWSWTPMWVEAMAMDEGEPLHRQARHFRVPSSVILEGDERIIATDA